MFDFPASPTVGQVSNGYTWNATLGFWTGGPGVSGPVTEQFFDLSGLATKDIPVPTWAKGCRATLMIIPGAAGIMALQASGDGTTFPATSGNYYFLGPWHAGGSGGYQNQASAASTYIPLSLASDLNITSQLISVDIQLTRPTTADYFGVKVQSSSYNSAATGLSLTDWQQGWIMPAMTTSLTLKALRFFGVTARAGSFVKVEWLGDSAAIPQSNAISDAPSDGGEYVRVSGVWRLKSQTLVLDGLTAGEVTVPTGAKLAKLSGTLHQATTTYAAPCWRGSLDGTTFMQAAADYFYVGFAHYTGSSGFQNLVGALANVGYLNFGTDYPAIGSTFEMTLALTRPSSAQNFIGMVQGSNYYSAATNYYSDYFLKSTLLSTNAGSYLAIKKLQFLWNAAQTFLAPSTVDCEWVY
jgi:hypothetical protein